MWDIQFATRSRTVWDRQQGGPAEEQCGRHSKLIWRRRELAGYTSSRRGLEKLELTDCPADHIASPSQNVADPEANTLDPVLRLDEAEMKSRFSLHY